MKYETQADRCFDDWRHNNIMWQCDDEVRSRRLRREGRPVGRAIRGYRSCRGARADHNDCRAPHARETRSLCDEPREV